ncbi:hypothetical protein B0A52_00125 [Exophiala mesophila]|uniref:Plasma membrane fusion protein PRM1 n=1 Tax=Exophiala mesophila TaxID=212818 RepID=A0A438NJ54_EXOME|nr:hypothetical protein B0A52_00125 [Exophiala mesophila]
MSAPPALSAGISPSMPAGSHEMRDYYSNQGPPRLFPHTTPSITPYLGLRARLSQIWFNRWTILLLLVLVRTLIAIASVDSNLISARREALAACSDVESMGSTMASMPHYMSLGVNELAATGVEKSVNGLMEMSTLSVTAVEEIVIFVIGMMTNTYLCLITLAVSGSLHAVIGALDSAQDSLDKMTKDLGDGLGTAVGDFSEAYNKLVDSLKGFVGFSVSGVNPPKLDLTKQEDALRALKLPPGFEDDLAKLNNSIPTFAEVKNLTESIIRLPFQEVKKLMADNMKNYTFDRSLFSVPQKQQLTFCSDGNGINSFFDRLTSIAHLARRVFLGVLITLAILVMIPMAWREIRRYRKMQERSLLVRSDARDPMDVVYLVNRPYTSTFGLRLSRGYESPRKRNLIRWVVAYATTDAALFVLALAIAGLFACACQAILLHALAKQVPALSQQVGDFSDQVMLQLNNASAQWAIATNQVITSTGQTINHDMLGWVEIATTAVNDTLNMFVDKTTEILDDVFGGTPLKDPIMGVLDCLALMKIAGIQKGITWVHDHAHVDFPLFPNDTFSVGAAQSLSATSEPDDSFLASPGDSASDKITSAVARFISVIEAGIRIEAIISTVILLLWILIVFIGIIRACIFWRGRDKVRGDGGDFHSSASPPTAVNPPSSHDFHLYNQDRRADFDNIPLSTVGRTNSGRHDRMRPSTIARPMSPAPRYSPPASHVEQEDHYDDPKQEYIDASQTRHNPFGDDKHVSYWYGSANAKS